jgi:AraC-like DNA-binding protein
MGASAAMAKVSAPSAAVFDGMSDMPLLLANRCQFSGTDYAATRRFIGKNTQNRYDFSLREESEFIGFQQRTAMLGSTSISVVDVDCTSDYHIAVGEKKDSVLLQIVLRGSAEICQGDAAATVGPGQALIVDSTIASRKFWRGPSQQVMIGWDRRHLEQTLAKEAGIGIVEPLRFRPLAVIDLKVASTFWSHLLTICRDLNDPKSRFGQGPAGGLAERMLRLLLLEAVPNNYAAALGARQSSPAVPYYVRRAEEYIRLHAREEISARDLVTAARVSARSLYQGFRTYRSSTPMGYLKAVRLDLARDTLLKGRAGGACVTDAAMGAGYANLSQFSRDYKRRFRETPSATLSRA